MPSTPITIVTVILLLPATSHGDDEIKSLITRLGKGTPASERIASAKKLLKVNDRGALDAVGALAKNCGDDNVNVRAAAVLALGGLLYRHERPCHVSLVRAMFDKDPSIRTNAGAYVGLMVKRLPKEAVPLLLRHAAHRDSSIRSEVLRALAESAGKDPTVRAILRQSVHDRDFLVRNNAIVALLKVTGDLSATVPHLLQLLDAPEVADRKSPEAARQQVAKIAVARRFYDLGREKPKEIITILLPLLKDESPVVRGAAARTLGAFAKGSEKAKRLLADMHVRQAVEALLNDEVESVRANAAIGLERLPK